MELKITGKNTQIAESLLVFTKRKMGKLEKLAKKELRVNVTFSEQTSKKSSKSCRAEVVLDTLGKVLTAKDDKENFYIAIDSVVEKLRRQLKKYKNKRIGKTKDPKAQHASLAISGSPVEQPINANELEITSFSGKPLNVDDALFNLKDSGRAFFLFVNEEHKINCVYRKQDGRFGLMVPEAS